MTSPGNEVEQECYGVGTSSGSQPPNLTWNILREFDLATYERYSRAFSNAFAPLDSFTIELVERNLQSYWNIQKYVGRLLVLGRDFGIPDRLNLTRSIMVQVINWLTSFRLFLDHAETYLKRRYGKQSAQFLRFKSETSTIYDGSAGYRFIYQFRNYVLHCGAPLSNVTIGRGDEHFAERFVSFTLKRDQLLRDFDWKTATEDLEGMAESFELEPLIMDAMAGLRDINSVLLDIAIEEGARTIADVREALELLPENSDGVPNLLRFTFSEDNERLVFSSQPFPTLDSIEKYEAVRDGSLLASTLHPRRVQPEPSVFDPEAIRESFHADNRAVQIMTMWFAEGGASSVVIDLVNQMMQEDSGVDSILTGFFKMTAVLVYMSAGAIGIDPAGLIGGLLDEYPTPAEE